LFIINSLLDHVSLHFIQKWVANSLLIGPIHLRQLRIKSSDCQFSLGIPDTGHCLLFYDEAVAKNLTSTKDIWKNTTYMSAAKTGSSSYSGKYATYGGDGYLTSFQSGINRFLLLLLLLLLIGAFRAVLVTILNYRHTCSVFTAPPIRLPCTQ